MNFKRRHSHMLYADLYVVPCWTALVVCSEYTACLIGSRGNKTNLHLTKSGGITMASMYLPAHLKLLQSEVLTVGPMTTVTWNVLLKVKNWSKIRVVCEIAMRSKDLCTWTWRSPFMMLSMTLRLTRTSLAQERQSWRSKVAVVDGWIKHSTPLTQYEKPTVNSDISYFNSTITFSETKSSSGASHLNKTFQ